MYVTTLIQKAENFLPFELGISSKNQIGSEFSIGGQLLTSTYVSFPVCSMNFHRLLVVTFCRFADRKCATR